ncbi:MAG: ATP-binding cassette domain-containing protein, partial [Eubacteriales bacterium]|nr:ATP-binding cassette domain-containing protein [Eubacteriales bacterium]
MIKIDNVTKVYDNGAIAVKDISINIEKGEFVFIIGTSGSGKSTFMKMLLKEIEPTKGTIKIDGVDINN